METILSQAATAPAESLAHTFLRESAMEALRDPEWAARLAVATLDTGERESLALAAASAALVGAGKALLESKAEIIFEVLCVSDRDALARSVGTAFGAPAEAALRADLAAFNALPPRSSCRLAAWRFPDGSYALRSSAPAEELERFALALLASPGMLAAVGGERELAVRRARALARSGQSALPLSEPELSRLLSTLSHGTEWAPGVRVLTLDGARALTPSNLVLR